MPGITEKTVQANNWKWNMAFEALDELTVGREQNRGTIEVVKRLGFNSHIEGGFGNVTLKCSHHHWYSRGLDTVSKSQAEDLNQFVEFTVVSVVNDICDELVKKNPSQKEGINVKCDKLLEQFRAEIGRFTKHGENGISPLSREQIKTIVLQVKDIKSMTAERLLNSGIDNVENIKNWAKDELDKLPSQANVRTKLSTLLKAFVARPDVAQAAVLEKARLGGVDLLDSFLAGALDTIKQSKSDVSVGGNLGKFLNASNLDASFPGITERIDSILKLAGVINLNLTDVESDANFNQNWEQFAVGKNVPQGKVQGNAPGVKDVEEKNINPETQGPSKSNEPNVAESNVQSPMERLKSLLTQEEQDDLSRQLQFSLDSDKGQEFAELVFECTNTIAKELAESKGKNQTVVDDIKKILKQNDAGDDVSNQDVYRAFIKNICEDEGLRETLMSGLQDVTPAGGGVKLEQVDQPQESLFVDGGVEDKHEETNVEVRQGKVQGNAPGVKDVEEKNINVDQPQNVNAPKKLERTYSDINYLSEIDSILDNAELKDDAPVYFTDKTRTKLGCGNTEQWNKMSPREQKAGAGAMRAGLLQYAYKKLGVTLGQENAAGVSERHKYVLHRLKTTLLGSDGLAGVKVASSPVTKADLKYVKLMLNDVRASAQGSFDKFYEDMIAVRGGPEGSIDFKGHLQKGLIAAFAKMGNDVGLSKNQKTIVNDVIKNSKMLDAMVASLDKDAKAFELKKDMGRQLSQLKNEILEALKDTEPATSLEPFNFAINDFETFMDNERKMDEKLKVLSDYLVKANNSNLLPASLLKNYDNLIEKLLDDKEFLALAAQKDFGLTTKADRGLVGNLDTLPKVPSTRSDAFRIMAGSTDAICKNLHEENPDLDICAHVYGDATYPGCGLLSGWNTQEEATLRNTNLKMFAHLIGTGRIAKTKIGKGVKKEVRYVFTDPNLSSVPGFTIRTSFTATNLKPNERPFGVTFLFSSMPCLTSESINLDREGDEKFLELCKNLDPEWKVDDDDWKNAQTLLDYLHTDRRNAVKNEKLQQLGLLVKFSGKNNLFNVFAKDSKAELEKLIKLVSEGKVPQELLGQARRNYLAVVRQSLRAWIVQARMSGAKVLVTGPIGSGAFGCKAEDIAQIMAEEFKNYGGDMQLVYSLYNDDAGNLEKGIVFKKHFSNNGVGFATDDYTKRNLDEVLESVRAAAKKK